MSGGGCRHSGVLTVASFVKAMAGIAMRREDGDLVAAILQPDGGINYQSLGPADAQVRMEEDNVLLRVRHGGLCLDAERSSHTCCVDMWKSRRRDAVHSCCGLALWTLDAVRDDLDLPRHAGDLQLTIAALSPSQRTLLKTSTDKVMIG